MKNSTIFLKLALAAIALAILVICVLVLPVGIVSEKTGYYRPILLGLYVAAAPFYFALYQAMKLLQLIDKNLTFTSMAAQALNKIKYCAALIALMFAIGMPYIYMVAKADDAPGVVAIGLIITFVSVVIAGFAGLLQRLLQNAIDIKSENDLTV